MKNQHLDYYDVAIVGAGPAGSTCAYELGKAGKKVALFDHSYPREKPCGGGIPIAHLAEFDIPLKLVDVFCSNLIIKSPSGEILKLYRKNSGATVTRKKLDNFLLKRATNVSDFFDDKVIDVKRKNKGWCVITKQRHICARYLVGADGCLSLVRYKILGPIDQKHLAHCVGYHLKHERKHIAKHFGDSVELHFYDIRGVVGYAWIFPKEEHVTIGLGDKLGVQGLKKRLDTFISNERRLAPVDKKAYSHLLPVVHDPKFFDLPTSGENWVLTGDAAGHVNPITGEGIYFAMVDGRLAAQAISSGNLKKYEQKWRTKIGSYFYLGAQYQSLFYTPQVLNVIIRNAKKSKELQNFLFDLIFSLRPYSELLTYRAIPNFVKIFQEVAKKTLDTSQINIKHGVTG